MNVLRPRCLIFKNNTNALVWFIFVNQFSLFWISLNLSNSNHLSNMALFNICWNSVYDRDRYIGVYEWKWLIYDCCLEKNMYYCILLYCIANILNKLDYNDQLVWHGSLFLPQNEKNESNFISKFCSHPEILSTYFNN